MVNTRAVTLKLLKKIENDKSYSNIILDKALSDSDYSAQEKKFISALFYGVVERSITLDAVINKYSKVKTKKLDTDVLLILRIGIYQLLYMDSVPDSAAVNESVKLAKKCKNPSLSGYVNGVLRAFIRNGKALPEGKNQINGLSVLYSCPEWLVEKWLNEIGEDKTVSLLKTSIGKARVTVRVNTTRMSVDEVVGILENDGFEVEKTFLDSCLAISGGVAVEKSKAYQLGLFHVQDISSQLCCMALEAKEGETVIDVCAAPGGKSFTVAEMMNNKGKVLSFDLHESRVKLIDDGAKRLGLDIVEAKQNDASVFDSDMPHVDRVLCDVPCSGLGVIRRKPEIKYKNPEDFDQLPEIQYNILCAASKYLKVGGILVYSTCTVSKAENENVVERFLKENHDFEGAVINNEFSELSDYKATIIPEYFNSDGFFIAKLKRIRA